LGSNRKFCPFNDKIIIILVSKSNARDNPAAAGKKNIKNEQVQKKKNQEKTDAARQ
jgi:hypothetical protein